MATSMPGNILSSRRSAVPRTIADMTALDGDLGWTLGVVFRAYVKASNAVMAEVPGGHRGYQVLTAAASDAAPSQSALGVRLGIDRTVLTYLLDDMERAGVVAR